MKKHSRINVEQFSGQLQVYTEQISHSLLLLLESEPHLITAVSGALEDLKYPHPSIVSFLLSVAESSEEGDFGATVAVKSLKEGST